MICTEQRVYIDMGTKTLSEIVLNEYTCGGCFENVDSFV